jgi:ubiquinone/menaquinone biosynthesis C-methylase UbiE
MPTDNTEQVEFWNGAGADRWVRHQELLDQTLEPYGRALLDVARPQSGERVLDVGCGCGWTSLIAAETLGARGAVLGVDVSAPMLERARQRAKAAGLSNATFTVADASTHPFEGTFDLLMSRFGVMFFADPIAAFSNLRRALRPGGRVTFVCWAPVADNHWFRVPMASAGTVVPLPEPTAPGAPGPFSFADPERVREVIRRAGFADASVEPSSPGFALGPDLDTAATNSVETGPVSRLLLEVDEATRGRVRAAIRDALKPYAGPRGVVLPAKTWIVKSRRT